jgi:hypothetical protein
MPFTLAHPAAVIPLRRLLGRFAVTSALVIGSVTPDCAYFLPFSVSRKVSHSVPALFWYCVPVGLAGYLLFHLVLKRPLVSLMPAALANRLGRTVSAARLLPPVPWSSVVVSLLIGAITHLIWDAFTHRGDPTVQALGFLRVRLFSVGGYRVFGYRLLQHVSTVLGMYAGVRWVRAWMRRTPAASHCTLSLPPRSRGLCVTLIVAPAMLSGSVTGLTNLPVNITVSAVLDALGDAMIAGITTLGVAVIAFAVLWHLLIGRDVNAWRGSTQPHSQGD